MEGAGRICAAVETVICLTGDQDVSEPVSGLCECEYMCITEYLCVNVYVLVVISRWFRDGVCMCVCVCLCMWLGRWGAALCINAWPRTCVSVQPCVTSNICSPAALPSEGG